VDGKHAVRYQAGYITTPFHMSQSQQRMASDPITAPATGGAALGIA